MTASVSTHQLSDHLSEERLYAFAAGEVTLAPTESAHLAACTSCRHFAAEVQLVLQELQVARQSEPTAAMLERYQTLFHENQAKAPNPIAAITAQMADFAAAIKATIMWNGRERLAMQGVRNHAMTSYRMLYSTEQAEIELLIEPVAGNFKIEGELAPISVDETFLPFLLEVHTSDADVARAVPIYVGESDRGGRFHIPPIPAGSYAIYLAPVTGATLLIDSLELA